MPLRHHARTSRRQPPVETGRTKFQLTPPAQVRAQLIAIALSELVATAERSVPSGPAAPNRRPGAASLRRVRVGVGAGASSLRSSPAEWSASVQVAVVSEPWSGAIVFGGGGTSESVPGGGVDLPDAAMSSITWPLDSDAGPTFTVHLVGATPASLYEYAMRTHVSCGVDP